MKISIGNLRSLIREALSSDPNKILQDSNENLKEIGEKLLSRIGVKNTGQQFSKNKISQISHTFEIEDDQNFTILAKIVGLRDEDSKKKDKSKESNRDKAQYSNRKPGSFFSDVLHIKTPDPFLTHSLAGTKYNEAVEKPQEQPKKPEENVKTPLVKRIHSVPLKSLTLDYVENLNLKGIDTLNSEEKNLGNGKQITYPCGDYDLVIQIFVRKQR